MKDVISSECITISKNCNFITLKKIKVYTFLDLGNRPKIKISLRRFDKFLEVAGIVLLIIIWILTKLNYCESSIAVPIHFNLSGKPDGYGDRLTLLFIPIIPTLIYFALTKINKHPHLFNYTGTITEHNTSTQYTIVTRMLRILKVSIALIFAIETICTYIITKGVFSGLGIWFLPVTILLIATPVAIKIIQSSKKEVRF